MRDVEKEQARRVEARKLARGVVVTKHQTIAQATKATKENIGLPIQGPRRR